MQISSLPTLLQTFKFNVFSSFLTFSRSNNWQEGLVIVKASSMFLRNLLNWGTFKDCVMRNVICHLPCVNKLFLLQLAQVTTSWRGILKLCFVGELFLFQSVHILHAFCSCNFSPEFSSWLTEEWKLFVCWTIIPCCSWRRELVSAVYVAAYSYHWRHHSLHG